MRTHFQLWLEVFCGRSACEVSGSFWSRRIVKGPAPILEVKLLNVLGTRFARASLYKIGTIHFYSCASWAPKLAEIVTTMSFRLAFGCVCMMKSSIVVNWGKMIQPWKPSPEVVGRPWGNFWARTHLIWRGIHRQNEFFSSCLDVFENSNFCFFCVVQCNF